ncbi:hypothetical protein FK531_09145 [Rhodococcus spelaei]|uniref:Integral membrane protein n=1 Tax=Rhodococcus spelaei TaxID=2546320 RepID=A0A541BMS2_9NOCA|nr:hypothetical protein [Rhodococcus spelaei]TQF73626.1 hypothetical protein FK531_09145 [Rhodococcus spelaei]
MAELAGRVAAATSGVAAGAHLVLAVLLLGQSLVTATVLGVMAGWCLNCAGHLWRTPTVRAWTVAAAGGAAMLAVHVGLMAVMPLLGNGTSMHHHGGSGMVDAPSAVADQRVDLGGLMTMSMVAVLVAEALLFAGAAATAVGRREGQLDGSV